MKDNFFKLILTAIVCALLITLFVPKLKRVSTPSPAVTVIDDTKTPAGPAVSTDPAVKQK